LPLHGFFAIPALQCATSQAPAEKIQGQWRNLLAQAHRYSSGQHPKSVVDSLMAAMAAN